jgi:hypothetical protein
VAIFGIVAALSVWLASEFTECYGAFRTREAAERAADAARDAGLGASVDHHPAEGPLPAEWAVTFDSGETGADAATDREAFREIVSRGRGKLGHPDGGCTERGHFE